MRRKRISIHAPPRGATLGRSFLRSGCRNFNSRPSARGDTAVTDAQAAVDEFQFTPLREGRLRLSFALVASRISIHAPPRGATQKVRRSSEREQISIHAPPRGATLWLSDNVCPANFNSRPSARGDKNHMAGLAERADFNSRPSARGDARCSPRRHRQHISIHAPPRGATSSKGGIVHRVNISIHAPPRGATY